jgi:SAM-dependent methyltransferase
VHDHESTGSMRERPAPTTPDDEWDSLQSRLASRLPYVRWLHERDANKTAEIENLYGDIDAKASEIVELRATLPLLTDLVWQPWYPALAATRDEIAAVANTTGFPDLYRTEEILYWLHLPGWIAEWAADESPSRMLDIGAGYGTLALFCAKLTGATVACLDIESHRMAESAMAPNGVTIREGNIETDSLDWAGSVDGVVMTEILEHFNFHPVPTMINIADALVPGGRLFLSTPDAASWGRVEGCPESYGDLPLPDARMPIEDRHIYQFSEDEVREVLTESGFRVLRFERAPGRWGLHHNVEAVKDE